jgi:hypothetical protein
MPPNTGPVGIGVGIRLNHHNTISHFFKLLLTKGVSPTSSLKSWRVLASLLASDAAYTVHLPLVLVL